MKYTVKRIVYSWTAAGIFKQEKDFDTFNSALQYALDNNQITKENYHVITKVFEIELQENCILSFSTNDKFIAFKVAHKRFKTLKEAEQYAMQEKKNIYLLLKFNDNINKYFIKKYDGNLQGLTKDKTIYTRLADVMPELKELKRQGYRLIDEHEEDYKYKAYIFSKGSDIIKVEYIHMNFIDDNDQTSSRGILNIRRCDEFGQGFIVINLDNELDNSVFFEFDKAMSFAQSEAKQDKYMAVSFYGKVLHAFHNDRQLY